MCPPGIVPAYAFDAVAGDATDQARGHAAACEQRPVMAPCPVGSTSSPLRQLAMMSTGPPFLGGDHRNVAGSGLEQRQAERLGRAGLMNTPFAGSHQAVDIRDLGGAMALWHGDPAVQIVGIDQQRNNRSVPIVRLSTSLDVVPVAGNDQQVRPAAQGDSPNASISAAQVFALIGRDRPVNGYPDPSGNSPFAAAKAMLLARGRLGTVRGRCRGITTIRLGS